MSSRPCADPAAAAQRLQEVLSDPLAETERLARGGARVVGLLCANLPEELPHALGLHPARLMVRPRPPTRSPEVLQTFACTWVQALLDQAMTGDLAHLSGVVFPCNTCDSFQNLPDIWRRAVAHPGPAALISVRMPVARQAAGAEAMLRAELLRWQGWLEQLAGAPLTPERLAASARLFNRIRAGLRELAALAAAGRLPCTELQAAAVAAQTMDRDEVAPVLEALAQAARGRPAPEADRARLMVVGGMLDDPRLLRWLHEHRVDVVADDTCALSRSFEPEADLDPDDALPDMARRHARRSACPVHLGSGAPRSRRLLERIRERGVQGVIFLPFKNCEPHAFDNVILAQALDGASVPHLTLELEPHLGNWGQLVTRLEAFVEMFTGLDELHDDLFDPPPTEAT